MKTSEKCKLCGFCCKLYYIQLKEDELNGKYRIVYDKNLGFTLAKKMDGSCVYLKDKKCTIYHDRPKSCRNYICENDNAVKIIAGTYWSE